VTSSNNSQHSPQNSVQNKLKRQELVFLFGCLLVALAVRYALIAEESVVNGDGMYYTILGERLVEGDVWNGVSAYWSPVYSLLTGVATLVSDREFAGRWISLLAGSMLLIPTFLLIRDIFGEIAARVSVVFLVFHPFLVLASGWVMTESLYTLMFMTALFAGWRALTFCSARSFVITGILWGLSFLTKPEALGYVVAVVVFSAVFLWFKSTSPRQISTGLFSLVSGFLILALPYVFFLYQKTGEWTLSQKIAVNFPAVDFEGELLELAPSGMLTMKDRIWGDDYQTEYSIADSPRTTEPRSDSHNLISDFLILSSKASTLLWKQFRTYFPALIPIPLALVALAGFLRGPWSRDRVSKEAYLSLFLLSTLLGYAASAVELRYLFPIIPVLMGWVANGISVLTTPLQSALQRFVGTRWAFSAPGLSLVLAIILLGPFIPIYGSIFKTAEIADVPFEERAAGLWIMRNAQRTDRIVMSSHITPAFYARASHLYLPDEDLGTVIEYASRRGVDYLVISSRRLNETPDFDSRSITMHPQLELLHQVKMSENHTTYVYAFRTEGAGSDQ
jgi:4-amino-4-deoxy-L-arabinose transferase-like glycosyltransferase